MIQIEQFIARGFAFGTFESRKSLASFILRILLFFLPALTLSHIVDEEMNRVYTDMVTDQMRILLLMFQTLIMIITFYVLVLYFESYSKEFQTTVAGGFFIATFFGFQPYYIDHLKEYMRRIY